MNLLLFNLATDADHVTLGFCLKWIEMLAARFDHIDVVTMYEGRYQLPENVRVWSVGRERGYPKWFRVIRFYLLVFRILRQRKIDVAFTHMIHSFAVLFWPVGRMTGIRNLLWYAHGAVPFGLRLAHLAADGVVSSTPEGFRIKSRKIRFIGQGIDTALFTPTPRKKSGSFVILSAGRLSPVKGVDIMLAALDGWHPPGYTGWRLVLAGDATNTAEREYTEALKGRAAVLQGGEVVFLGRIDSPRIARLLAEANLFVNLSATGSLDKAIVEAMAAGCPVLSCNEAFRAITKAEGIKAVTVTRTAEGLRAGLERSAAMTMDEMSILGFRLAETARRDHGLDGLIKRLHERLLELARSPA